MRITNNMLISNMSYNLNQNLNRLEKLQYQTSTGKKFRLPSDDPIGASKSLKLRTDLAKSQQYRRNVSDAKSWMRETEGALKEINNILHRANQLTIQAANETYDDEDLLKIREEVSELRESLIQIGNSTYGGRYIFTGYKTDQPLLDEDGNYNVDISYTYERDEEGFILDKNGERLKINNTEIKTDEKIKELLDRGEVSEEDLAIKRPVMEYNIGVSERVKVNTLGNSVFGVEKGELTPDYKGEIEAGDKPYLIAMFEELEEALGTEEGQKPDNEKLNDLIEKIQDARGNILSVTAEIGARSNRLELTEDKLEDQELNFNDLLSDVEDVSLPEAYMNFMLEMNVYTASLSVSSQVVQQSLVDFIR